MIENFKRTFSHSDVQIHFVGAWLVFIDSSIKRFTSRLIFRDTVSSIGIIRQMPLPLTDQTDHVCFFRHALALDERRVKFIPEYLITDTRNFGYTTNLDRKEDDGKGNNNPERDSTAVKPNAMPVKDGQSSNNSRFDTNSKEVWFAGTHSDM